MAQAGKEVYMDTSDTTFNTDSDNQATELNADSTNTGSSTSAREGKECAFVPVTTQKDFEKAFARRWAREKAKYDEFDTYKASHNRLDKVEAELNVLRERALFAENKVAEFEKVQELEALKTEIAKQEGIDPRLVFGSSKEELEQCARTVKEVIGETTAPRIGSGVLVLYL